MFVKTAFLSSSVSSWNKFSNILNKKQTDQVNVAAISVKNLTPHAIHIVFVRIWG